MSDERRRRADERRAEVESSDLPDASARTRRLAERAEEVDRRARFERRLRTVRTRQERRRRRDRRLRLLAWDGGCLAAATVGYLLGGALGAVAGVGGVGLALVGVVVVRRLAARRGAPAWDWRAGRHRLLGDPSQQVRARDEPRDPGGPPHR